MGLFVPFEEIRCLDKEETSYFRSVDTLLSFLKSALLCWCIHAIEDIKDDIAK